METKRFSRKFLAQLITEHPTLEKIFRRIWIDQGCWFINEDWSVYTQIEKQPGHRYMFRVFNPDKSIEGKEVCHKCDRRGCINPEHLFRGTHSDNIKDARKKGRILIPKSAGPISLYKLRKREDEKNLRYTLAELRRGLHNR